MQDLGNKVIWITGASSGIGEALAYAFAEHNTKLVLSARREEELIRVKNNCKKALEVMVLPLDLTQSGSFVEKTQQVINHFGQIDILVNNGGISQRSLTKDTVLDVDRKIMEVNFFGAVAMTKAVLPEMLKRQLGLIVNISSIVGKVGVPLRSAYSASKHAIHGFFDAARAELWSDGIRVLNVCPGFIRTEVSRNALTADGSKHNKMDEATDQGISAEECANQIIKAIQKEKDEVIIAGKREKQAVFLKRFFPNSLNKRLRTLKVT